MAEVIKMPRLSDTMEEGVVSQWLKKVGDKVSEGDILAEIETDKATMEFESFYDGTLLHIAIDEGVTADVDSLLCIIGEEGEDISQYLSLNEDEPKQLDLVDQINEQEESVSLEPVLISSEEQKPEKIVDDLVPSNQDNDIDFSKVEYITMPRLSDTMEEGTISTWLKKVGDDVNEGDILAEIETDKATMEFESFYDGKLIHIGVKEGETVNVDELIAVISSTDVSAEQALANYNSESAAPEAKENIPTDNPAEIVDETESLEQDLTISDKRVFASPLAKKIAADKNIDLTTISGSGDNGRIIKSDLDNVDVTPINEPIAVEDTENNTQTTAPTIKPSANITKSESFDEIDNNSMRKAIAKRLSTSKFSAPHYYLSVEFSMDNAIAFREQYNSIPNTKISFNDIVIKACAIALREHPKVNSQWSDNKTRLNHHIHIGVAVGVEDGLVVPVIKFADSESLHSINSVVRDFAVRAKSKKLRPDEIEGSTFTISNLGMFGINEFTSIINQPNSAILSVGSIIKKPVVIDDKITIGNTMKLTLACDHRTIDGVTGSLFLQTLKGYLENPVTILV
ncbi:MAG: pyruvate dehydrogenase [Cryomorphaceae bacterium]|nr:MAG: pyruvate dehydrogenase [Cryomorphaceae bacterium]